MARGQDRNLRPFERAILKYGWKAFQFRNLITGLSEAQLDRAEEVFIAHFRSNVWGTGYNATSGGDCPREISRSTIKKIIARNEKPTLWVHQRRGSFFGSAAELIRAFPEDKLGSCNLSKLRRGLTSGCVGWVCPSAPKRERPSCDAPRVWTREDGRRFFGTSTELAACFPEGKLTAGQLNGLASRPDKFQSCHGWRLSESKSRILIRRA